MMMQDFQDIFVQGAVATANGIRELKRRHDGCLVALTKSQLCPIWEAMPVLNKHSEEGAIILSTPGTLGPFIPYKTGEEWYLCSMCSFGTLSESKMFLHNQGHYFNVSENERSTTDLGVRGDHYNGYTTLRVQLERITVKKYEEGRNKVIATKESPLKELQEQPTSNKKFQCNICDKVLRAKTSLREHLTIHDNLRAFKCGICKKGFKRRKYLSQHVQRIHSTNKVNRVNNNNNSFRPHKCHMCRRRFDTKTGLSCHVKAEHYRRPAPLRPHCSSNDNSNIKLTFKIPTCVYTTTTTGGMKRKKKAKGKNNNANCAAVAAAKKKVVSVRSVSGKSKTTAKLMTTAAAAVALTEKKIAKIVAEEFLSIQNHFKKKVLEAAKKTLLDKKLELKKSICAKRSRGSGQSTSAGTVVRKRKKESRSRRTCRICLIEFRQIQGLSKHMISGHSEDGEYDCEFCPCNFKSKQVLAFHTARYHSGFPG